MESEGCFRAFCFHGAHLAIAFMLGAMCSISPMSFSTSASSSAPRVSEPSYDNMLFKVHLEAIRLNLVRALGAILLAIDIHPGNIFEVLKQKFSKYELVQSRCGVSYLFERDIAPVARFQWKVNLFKLAFSVDEEAFRTQLLNLVILCNFQFRHNGSRV
ncbi:hypothetical protein DL93DRAFT_1845683 [Clavulina sp. PMI_390]|nr:hypothetical protein DL93DRAFT_1845683 [Clavulina sp. PMI_390]